MITIFSIPKAFNGHIAVTQENALASWRALHPDVEIILFGEEEGMKEAAQKYGARLMPDIKKNANGTPFLSDVFNRIQKIAQRKILCYVNGDIILTKSLIENIKYLPENNHNLMLLRRIDMDIDRAITFAETTEHDLMREAAHNGSLHGPSAFDVMVFPRGLNYTMPDFLVGRPGWDNAFIYQLIKHGVTIIDGTRMITAIHQNHDYSHNKAGREGVWSGKEAWYNFNLAGGFSQMATIRNAHYMLTAQGLEKPPIVQRIYSSLSLFYPVRKLLGLKRWLYTKHGL